MDGPMIAVGIILVTAVGGLIIAVTASLSKPIPQTASSNENEPPPERFVRAYPWKAYLTIPFVEGSHAFFHAFLRTSRTGMWEVDAGVLSDAFVLNYRRGKRSANPPRTSFFYLPSPGEFDQWAKSVSDPLLRLKISLRPVPDCINASIECCLDDPHVNLLRQYDGDRLFSLFFGEVSDLADYLKEVCRLSEAPKVTIEQVRVPKTRTAN